MAAKKSALPRFAIRSYGPTKGYVRRPVVSPDEKLLALGANGELCTIWNIKTGKQIRRFGGPVNSSILSRQSGFSPDGTIIWMAADEKMYRWDLRDARPKDSYTWKGTGKADDWQSVRALSPEHGTFVTSGRKSGTLLRDLATGEVLKTILRKPVLDDPAEYSPDLKTLKLPGHGFWNLKTGKLAKVSKKDAEKLKQAAYSCDGKTAAYGLHDYENPAEIVLIDTKTGKRRGCWVLHKDVDMISMHAHPTELVWFARTQGLKALEGIWRVNAKTRKPEGILELGEDDVLCQQFSPGGRYSIAEHGDNCVVLQDYKAIDKALRKKGFRVPMGRIPRKLMESVKNKGHRLTDFFTLDASTSGAEVQTYSRESQPLMDERAIARGELKLKKPYQVRVSERRVFHDFLDNFNFPIVRAHVVDVLKKAKLTGWKTFPVSAFDKKNKKIKDKYFGIAASSHLVADHTPPLESDDHKSVGDRLITKGPVFDVREWDGSDFFTNQEGRRFFVTPRFVDTLQEAGISGWEAEGVVDRVLITPTARAAKKLGKQSKIKPAGKPYKPKVSKKLLRAPALSRLIKKHGLSRVQSEFVRQVRPSVILKTQKITAGALAVGATRLGGQPDLPAKTIWPTWKGLPQGFVGQFNLADFAPHDAEGLLPKTGLLSFFCNMKTSNWTYTAKDRGSWTVLYHKGNPAKLATRDWPAEMTDELVLKACAVELRPSSAVPGTETDLLKPLKLSKDERDGYFELHGSVAKSCGSKWLNRVLGWADPAQGDPAAECASARRRPKTKPSDWQLLFQVDSDPSLNAAWVDEGRIYYYIRKSDLKKRKFDDTHLAIQIWG